MKNEPLFLVFIDGNPEGVMTMRDALQYAWNRDCTLFLESLTDNLTKRG